MAAFPLIQQVLARVGIGACTATLVPHSHLVRHGDTLHGEVQIAGGEVDQQLTDVTVDLLVAYIGDYDDRTTAHEFVAATATLPIAHAVHDHEVMSVPFTITVPETAPAVAITSAVSLQAHVHVALGLTRSAQAPVTVLPSAGERTVSLALRQLGLQLAGSRCVVPPRALPGQAAPFVQECFWRVPVGRWPEITDVTTVMLPHGSTLELFIEVNREERCYDRYVGPAYTVEQRYRQLSLPQPALNPSVAAALIDSALQCCPRCTRGESVLAEDSVPPVLRRQHDAGE